MYCRVKGRVTGEGGERKDDKGKKDVGDGKDGEGKWVRGEDVEGKRWV